jgi:hypothetical protein
MSLVWVTIGDFHHEIYRTNAARAAARVWNNWATVKAVGMASPFQLPSHFMLVHVPGPSFPAFRVHALAFDLCVLYFRSRCTQTLHHQWKESVEGDFPQPMECLWAAPICTYRYIHCVVFFCRTYICTHGNMNVSYVFLNFLTWCSDIYLICSPILAAVAVLGFECTKNEERICSTSCCIRDCLSENYC